eukprot:Colp12_sorted_trinity150504_noHs@23288
MLITHEISMKEIKTMTEKGKVGRDTTYKAYSIETKPIGSQIETKVWRRYSDFEALHEYLAAKYEDLIVPPMPAKGNVVNWVAGDDAAFLDKRRKNLWRFVLYVVSQPKLAQDAVTQTFLQKEDWSCAEEYKALPDLNKTLASSYKLKNDDIYVAERFAQYNALQQALNQMVAIADKTRDKEQAILQDTQTHLQLFTNINNDYEGLNDYVTGVRGHIQDVCTSLQKSVEFEHEDVWEQLRDYSAYLEGAKSLVLRFQKRQADYEHKVEVMTNKSLELEQIRAGLDKSLVGFFKKDTPEQREVKVQAAQKAADDAKEAAEAADKEARRFLEAAKAELENFQHVRVARLRKLMQALAKYEIQKHQAAISCANNIKELSSQ